MPSNHFILCCPLLLPLGTPAEGFNMKKTDLPREDGILPGDWLPLNSNCNSSLGLQTASLPYKFWTCQPHNNTCHSLEINQSGIEPESPALQADSLTTEKSWYIYINIYTYRQLLILIIYVIYIISYIYNVYCKIYMQNICWYYILKYNIFICVNIKYIGASLMAQLVKNPRTMQETLVQFLGREDPLEKG